MKYIYGLFIFFILFFMFSCSSDDYKKPPLDINTDLVLWPLQQSNYWLLSKDTINDTIKIDTSYYVSTTNFFKTSGLAPFLSLDSLNSSTTALFVQDSVYYIHFDEFSIQENYVTSYSLPIVITKNSNEFSATTSFQQISFNDTLTVTVNSNSQVIERNATEAVGGQVFTQVTKVKNRYTYLSANSQQIILREIWFQAGVGPIKIVDENQNISYTITAYQLAEVPIIL